MTTEVSWRLRLSTQGRQPLVTFVLLQSIRSSRFSTAGVWRSKLVKVERKTSLISLPFQAASLQVKARRISLLSLATDQQDLCHMLAVA